MNKHNIVEFLSLFVCIKCGLKASYWMKEIYGGNYHSSKINTNAEYNLKYTICEISDSEWKMKELLR